MSIFKNVKVKYEDSPNLDAFGRLRTSQPFTVFDSKQIFDDADIANYLENSPLFFDNKETSGSMTTTLFDVNRASTTLSVSVTTVGTRVRQTKQRFNYQSGKSQFVLFTGIFGAINSGITKRYGYFDENNGWFFESDGTNFAVVRRTNVTGTSVDNKVIQSAWSIDKMDGTGPSKITFDITKSHIYLLDFQWLGVGRIRMALDIDGVVVPVHEFLIANILNTVSVSTPNLPIRCEISNDGTGIADSLEVICCAAMTEGQLQANGVNLNHSNGTTVVNADVAGTYYALLGIRLRSTHLGVTLLPHALSILSGTGNYFHWVACFNPTIAGTFTYSNLANSAVQTAIGVTANTVSDLGTEIISGYSPGDASLFSDLVSALKLGSLIDGTPDELVLVVAPLTATATVLGSISWKELI